MCLDRFAYLEQRIFLRLAERGADLDRAQAVARKVRRAAERKWQRDTALRADSRFAEPQPPENVSAE